MTQFYTYTQSLACGSTVYLEGRPIRVVSAKSDQVLLDMPEMRSETPNVYSVSLQLWVLRSAIEFVVRKTCWEHIREGSF